MVEWLLGGNAWWFSVPALLGTAYFVLNLVIGEMGADADLDVDAADSPTSEFRVLSLQSISAFAFEAARSLYRGPVAAAPRLTDRQRECLVWAARGKTDPQISRILGIRHGTVVEHMRNARRRYEAPTRARLAVRALFDGALHFGEVGEP